MVVARWQYVQYELERCSLLLRAQRAEFLLRIRVRIAICDCVLGSSFFN